MEKIEKVVVVMMENRSFDSVLGWLYEQGETPANVIAEPPQGDTDYARNYQPYIQRPFNGLDGVDLASFANRYTNAAGAVEFSVEPKRGVSVGDSPYITPCEEFEHVNVQLYPELYNQDEEKIANPEPGKRAPMTGFVQDFSSALEVYGSPATQKAVANDPALKRELLGRVMESHTPAQLPVISGLARGYALSDMWFASIPTQTDANRAYLFCGTSGGAVNNNYYFPEDQASATGLKINDIMALSIDRYEFRTIWNVLAENGIDDWGVYYSEYQPVLSYLTWKHQACYSRIIYGAVDEIEGADDHFRPIDQFHQQARSGTLPAFTFLEPSWGFSKQDLFGNDSWEERWAAFWDGVTEGKLKDWVSTADIVTLIAGGEGCDYHPPRDTRRGENFLREIYQSLTADPEQWAKTLLVVTFDEHVGSFDHVPPPWDATPPWGDRTPTPEDLQNKPLEHGFQFDRFGVRIPTLLVSPWVDEKTIFRASAAHPYDHTSVIASLLDWFKIDRAKWKLGERVANAPTFNAVINRDTPRDDLFEPHRPAPGEALQAGDLFTLAGSGGEAVVAAGPLTVTPDNISTLNNGLTKELRKLPGAEALIKTIEAVGGNALGQFFGQRPTPRLDTTGHVALQLLLGSELGPILNRGAVQIATHELHVQQHYVLTAEEGRGLYGNRADAGYSSSSQGWSIVREGSAADDHSPIKVGDSVAFLNGADGRWLASKDGRLITVAEADRQFWILAPAGVPKSDDGEVKMGDKVHLKHLNSGRYLTSATEQTSAWFGTGQYFATLLGDAGRVTLTLQGEGTAALADGAEVRLRTTERMVGKYNLLGAWESSHDLYYYYPSPLWGAKQEWSLRRAKPTGGAGGALRYGEPIHVVNKHFGQNLARDRVFNGYFTSEEAATDGSFESAWVLERAE